MCSGTEAGSYLDSCITQLKAQGPSRTCNESKEEEGSLNLRNGDAILGRAEQPLPRGRPRPARLLRTLLTVLGLRVARLY